MTTPALQHKAALTCTCGRVVDRLLLTRRAVWRRTYGRPDHTWPTIRIGTTTWHQVIGDSVHVCTCGTRSQLTVHQLAVALAAALVQHQPTVSVDHAARYDPRHSRAQTPPTP